MQDRDKLEAFLRKAKKANFVPDSFPSIAEQCEMSDFRLFNAITSNTAHVLHHLLPKQKTGTMSLRKRRHNYSLPAKITKLDESNFLYRMLYYDVY